MWLIPLTPLIAAVRTLNVPNVSSSSRDLALVDLCFLRTDFLAARLPRRFFEQMLFAFLSVPGVSCPGSCLPSSDVLGAAIPPRVGFSIVDTVACSCVPSEHSSSPRFGSHVFCGGGVPTLLPQAPLLRETFCFVWVHHRQSMLLAGLHCQHRRVLQSIDVVKKH